MQASRDVMDGLKGLPKMAFNYVFRPFKASFSSAQGDRRILLLRRVEFYSSLEAGAAGLLSGLMVLLVVSYVDLLPFGVVDTDAWGAWIRLAVVLALGAVITVGEMLLLYYLSLRNARLVSSINHPEGEERTDEQALISLVNACLQTPNFRMAFHGINPRERLPRWKLLLAAVFMKTKVSISRAFVKMIWRRFALRVLGRSLARGALELASLPVFVFWNMWVMLATMKEVRWRSEVPRREHDLLVYVFGESGKPSEEERLLVLRAFAGRIQRTGDVHPNIERLFEAVMSGLPKGRWHAQEPPLSLSDVDAADPVHVALLHRAFTVAMVVDPRATRGDRRRLRALHRSIGDESPSLRDLKRSILEGQPISAR